VLSAGSFGLGGFGRIQHAVAILRYFGQAKIEDFGRSTRGHKNISGLDVAVHNALGMGRVQGIRHID